MALSPKFWAPIEIGGPSCASPPDPQAASVSAATRVAPMTPLRNLGRMGISLPFVVGVASPSDSHRMGKVAGCAYDG